MGSDVALPPRRPTLPAVVLDAIKPEYRTARGEDGRFDSAIVVGYRLTRRLPPESLIAAIAALEASLTAGGADSIREMRRLRLVTRKRESADDLEAAKIYADVVERYPVAVVRQAVDELIESATWWPSIPELLQAFAKVTGPRHLLVRALKRALAEVSTPPPSEPTRDEEIASLRKLLYRDRKSDPARAARWERMLAGLEGREAEEWARRWPQAPATLDAPRPIDVILADLALKARQRLAARGGK